MVVRGQFHVLSALPTATELFVPYWVGGFMDPRAGLDAVENSKALTHAENRT
jgi:hypothetical protein